jgi:hypothetical protein
MTSIRCALVFGVGGLAVAAAACQDDAVTPSPVVRYAAIQFVNAVPDTGEMDFRVVDIVSNAGLFDAVFRDADSFPQPIEVGQRQIRVFMSSLNDQAVASTVVWDTVYDFVESERYTFTLQGYARTGQTPALRAVIERKVAAPAPRPDTVAIRVRHLAPALDPNPTTPVDVWVVARGSAALSGTPTIQNVSFGDTTSYAFLPRGTYRVAVTATGTTAPILFQSNLPPGAAAAGTGSAIAGTNVAGSALTIALTGRSVEDSRAPFSFYAIRGFSSITTTGTTMADTMATAVTPTPHGLTTADTVIINAAVDTVTGVTGGYNGTFPVVQVVDANTFIYRINGPRVRAAVATGHPFWLLVRNGSKFNGRPISSLTSVGATATVLTMGGHALATNDIVTIRGASEAAYNGSFAVTVVNTTTFTYTTNGTPSASPATGTPVYRAASVDFAHPNVTVLVDRRP